MTEQPKYPGDWVVTQLLEGTLREQVSVIAAQIGSSVMPDNAQWVNRFAVESTSSNAVYTVSRRRTDGTWGCSCPGWRMHSNRKCKHLADILSRLVNLDATVTPAVKAHVASKASTADLSPIAPVSELLDMLASARAAQRS
jgi:hypothetical protein